MNLSFLFASFGHQLHQVFISYGLLFGVSCSAVRETSSMMVGQYFKMRRDLAEMWSVSGVGMGILIFSLLYFQSIGSVSTVNDISVYNSSPGAIQKRKKKLLF